ncbi:MAG: winged helix-turn-helix domain-containing protein [Acidobacteria bacterium]|nr:winged helix-turn-helix domain-containing protein [Acidobacteriota bacterium]
MALLSKHVIRFGPYEVDPDAGELRKNGHRVRLQEQPLRILLMLLQHPGETMPREKIQQQLWPDGTFVDFEHGVNTAVRKLRTALGDDPDAPRFIETVPRRGYRFIAAIDSPEVSAESPASQIRQPPATGVPHRRPPKWIIATLVAAVLLVSGIVASRSSRVRRRLDGGQPIRSIAVLPLANLSGDPSQEYFADAMTDALTTELAKISSLRVISRTSVMQYKGTRKALPEIANELNVDSVVEGSVLRSNNRLRITAQLIQARKDQHLWAEAYERDLGDVLKLQRELARDIAEQVRAQLTPQQRARLGSARRVDPEAYELFVRGSLAMLTNFSTPQEIKQGQSYFEQAIQKDPDFALAYVGLADCYTLLGGFRALPPQAAYNNAQNAIKRALELDDSLGEAHNTLAFLTWEYEWDWPAVEREYRHAIELKPSYVEGHGDFAMYLGWSGNPDEAFAEISKVRELLPLAPAALYTLPIYYYGRDYQKMVATALPLVAADPNGWLGHYFLGVGYEGSGRQPEAVAEYERAVELSKGDQDALAALAHVYSSVGRKADAEKVLRRFTQTSNSAYVSPYMIASVYSALGERDKAFAFLEKAYQERCWDLAHFLKADLRVDDLRSDRRFQDLLRRMHLLQ